MNTDIPLTPQELALFRGLVKPAAVYMLMLHLDRPTGAREVAGILGIHEQTAAKYLRALSRLNLVARVAHRNGYVLPGVHPTARSEEGMAQPILQPEAEDGEPDDPVSHGISCQAQDMSNSQFPARNVKYSPAPSLSPTSNFSQHPAGTMKTSQYPVHNMKISQQPLNTITTTSIKLINNLNESVVGGVVNGDRTSKKSQNGDTVEQSEVWSELSAAGICANRRTRALVRLPHITPEYVRAHRLKLEESGKSGPRWTGLLVTILEKGEPAPTLNPFGHLESCECQECHRHALAKSWGDFLSRD